MPFGDWLKAPDSGAGGGNAQLVFDAAFRADAPAAGPAAAEQRWLRFASGEDALLRRAVADNRGLPNKKSPNGIKWRAINEQAMAGAYGEALRARVTSLGSKVLSKRWWLICPADYPNRKRKIR